MRTLQNHNVMTDHSLHETYVLVDEAQDLALLNWVGH